MKRKTRYQIFVSSTYKDLIEERRIVKKAIIEMQYFPSSMEEFPAIDQNQFEYIKCEIDNSDYYILIFGGSLGSINDETRKSYTRMEYDYALGKGMPVIALIRKNENGEIVCTEVGERKDKYLEFVSIVETNRICSYFINKDELSGLVHLSLNRQIDMFPRSGWIKKEKKKYRTEENLLLRGDIIDEFHIGREIYEVQDQYIYFEEVSSAFDRIALKYGKGTQGTFKFIIFINQYAYNFFHEVDKDYFDSEGILLESTNLQMTFARLGNYEEILLFFSVGQSGINMYTEVFRIDNFDLKKIGKISGQEYMTINYDISVPYGSQGLFEQYVFCKGSIFKLDNNILENE